MDRRLLMSMHVREQIRADICLARAAFLEEVGEEKGAREWRDEALAHVLAVEGFRRAMEWK